MPAVNVTTAACNLGPNADPAISAGNRAVVRSRHSRQRNWCVRYPKLRVTHAMRSLALSEVATGIPATGVVSGMFWFA